MKGMKGEEKAIGIDLGTSYSCVAVWHDHRVEVIVNDQGNRTTPSMVAFTPNETLVGDGAKLQISSNPLNTVFDVKRLVGRKFSDSSVQADTKLWPFRGLRLVKDKPVVLVTFKGQMKLFTPVEISSMVLVKMKTIAERYIGSEVRKAVITVPAYFSDCQREKTKVAGRIAGLKVMRIINEPTAAAIAYGFGRALEEKKNILVFHLGGGTFDVSVVAVEKGKFEVKAVGGESHLGGEDFDSRLVAYCAQKFNNKYKTNVCASAKALRRLRSDCERAKRSLSWVVDTVIDIDGLYEGHDFFIVLRRAKFEELNLDLFEKCMERVKKCVEDAELSKGQIDDIVLVGGSSRIPKVQEMVTEFFDGKEPCRAAVNPDEAVACGAAIQAAALNKEKDVHIAMEDVTPLSLGISVSGGAMLVVVPRNTPLPARMETTVTTLHDDQTRVSFKVYEGERLWAADNNRLGKFVLSGVPAAPAGEPSVGVCFAVDADGILSVSARHDGSGAHNAMVITNGEINTMKMDGEDEFSREDEEARQKIGANKDLEGYMSAIKRRAAEALAEASMKADLAGDLISGMTTWLNDNDAATSLQLKIKFRELVLKSRPLFCNKRSKSSKAEE